MIGKIFDKIFSSKIFYIVFSLLIAAVLWIYVELNENRIIPHRIENIPVEFINEDVFRDRNLMISGHEQKTITLTVDCTRSVSSRLTNRTVTAVVDLSAITSNGNYLQPYTIVYPQDVGSGDVSRPTKSVEYIALDVDIMHDRIIPVEVIYNGGTASSEFIAEKEEFSPQYVTVFGPEAVVSRIDKAKVIIIRENLSTTYRDELPFVLIGDDGQELDSDSFDSLTFDQDRIRVTVPISMLKQVALQVELMYGAGATAQNTFVTIDPPSISVSGDPDTVSDYNIINLGTIDVSRFDSSYADTFPIVIQNAFTDVSNIKEALVTVEVRGLEIKHLSITNIHVVNTPRDLEAIIISQSVDVRIRGKREDLDRLTADSSEEIGAPLSVRVVADISDYSAGTARIPARVHIDGDVGDIGAVGDCRITVSLVRPPPPQP